jgi:hypothetical protein
MRKCLKNNSTFGQLDPNRSLRYVIGGKMKLIKATVLFAFLFPTTTFADEIFLIAKNDSKPRAHYDNEIQKLDSDSSQLTASMLNRGTASGTKRAPASEFQVTLIKKSK